MQQERGRVSFPLSFPQRAQSQAILHLKHTIVHNFTPCENDPSPPMSSQPIPQHQTNYYEGFAVLVKKKTVLPE